MRKNDWHMFYVVAGSTARADLQSIVDQKCTKSGVGMGGQVSSGERIILL